VHVAVVDPALGQGHAVAGECEDVEASVDAVVLEVGDEAPADPGAVAVLGRDVEPDGLVLLGLASSRCSAASR
jgi:hypothetical protein